MADDDLPPTPCPIFLPDHNGECLQCDEWIDAHTPEAIAAGERPHYRCPRCTAVSFHPTDIAEKYCGRCHQFEVP